MRNNRYVLVIAFLILAAASISLLTGCPERATQRTRATSTTVAGTSTTTTVKKTQNANFIFPKEIKGLNNPIAMAFAPDNRIFITERGGRVRVFESGKLQEKPFVTVDVPKLTGYHETGLLGIAVHPNFKARPYVYIYYTYRTDSLMFNRIARYRFSPNTTPTPEVLLNKIPAGRIHNGGVLAFGPDGNLYASTGETGARNLAQDVRSTAGKVLRMTPSGGIPADNPFKNSPVYSYGHRNIFGMAFDPKTKALYVTENGPSSSDEINKIEAGKNYGWPLALGKSTNKSFVSPILVYGRSIAPTQAIFYTGDVFPSIKNWFVFGSYVAQDLHSVELTGTANNQVKQDKVVLHSNQPIIGVAQSPDGVIYITTRDSIKRVEVLRNITR